MISFLTIKIVQFYFFTAIFFFVKIDFHTSIRKGFLKRRGNKKKGKPLFFVKFFFRVGREVSIDDFLNYNSKCPRQKMIIAV